MSKTDMESGKTIDGLIAAGAFIQTQPDDLMAALHRTEINNPWFTQLESLRMLDSMCTKLLAADALQAWIAEYNTNPA